jgi:hypothetical protein
LQEFQCQFFVNFYRGWNVFISFSLFLFLSLFFLIDELFDLWMDRFSKMATMQGLGLFPGLHTNPHVTFVILDLGLDSSLG